MHQILTRQIKRFLGETSDTSPDLKKFLDAVSDTYTHFDEDYAMIDRSLSLSSKEFLENSTRLQEAKEKVEELVKKRTQELHEEKARLLASVQSLSLGFGIFDLRGKMIQSNASFSRMLGDGSCSDDIECIENEFNDAFRLRPLFDQALKFRQPIETKNIAFGKKKFFRIFISPIILNESDEIIGAVMILEDTTKEQEIDRAKTEFVSLASHQLKTPVGAINWDLEMLLGGDYGELTPKQMMVLREINDLNQRVNDLINSLLNVSRVELGVFVIEPVPTDFISVCESVLVEMESKRLEKSHVVIKNFQDDLPHVPADPKLLRIIFQNFISNAIKYTPKEGKITLSIKVEESGILIGVANTGEPIPKEDQKNIFSKMFRASNAQEMDPDGNGLGLYLAKQIMEAAGGRIWFTSEEGQDTTFYVSIPLSGMRSKEGSKKLA